MNTQLTWFRITASATIAGVIILTFLLATTLRDATIREVNKRLESRGRTLILDAELVDIDPQLRFVTVDWNIKKETQSACNDEDLSGCRDVLIFADTNLLYQNGLAPTPLSNNRLSQPIFYFNATAFATHDAFNAAPIFRMPVALTQFYTGYNLYPFDSYSGILYFFGQESGSNNSVSLRVGNLEGALSGCRVSFNYHNAPLASDQADAVLVHLTITRGPLVKVYVLIIIIVIWAISLVFLVLTVQSVVFRYPQKGEVLLAPAMTLFAFTSLRGTMPGIPPFGTFIDYVSHLPCLGILAMSATLTAGVYIFRDPTANQQSIQDLTVAERLSVDTVNVASDVITYYAAAVATESKRQTDILRGNSGSMKTMVATQKAIRATQNALDAAEKVVGRDELADLRERVDGFVTTLNAKVPSSYPIAERDRTAVGEQADIARDAAEIARDAFNIIKVGGNCKESDDVERLYLDALDAAGDASLYQAEIVAITCKEQASDAQAAMLKAVFGAHRAIKLAFATVDAVQEVISDARAREHRAKLIDAEQMLAVHPSAQSTQEQKTEIQDAVVISGVALQAARKAADTAIEVVKDAQSILKSE